MIEFRKHSSGRDEQTQVVAFLVALLLMWLRFHNSVYAQPLDQDTAKVEQNVWLILQFGFVASNVGPGGLFGIHMAKRNGFHFGGRFTGGIKNRSDNPVHLLFPLLIGGTHGTSEYSALVFYTASVERWMFRIGAGPAYAEERVVDFGTSRTIGIAISGHAGRVFSTYGSFGLDLVADINNVQSLAGVALTVSIPISW